ncbi:NERD domain-containing protein [Pelotomaculum propionicicum]|uniref:nuclease-related domain-containing DEAD/DEAH box helicase n=1 Tax=Pelotomaculum propionicicum TaxID=258475 RepID=UPI003B80C859
MIPSVIYSGCPSPGEQEIFRRLKEDPSTKDWVVLHSLDIPEHRSQVSGEIDFVIIIPSKGVLCLEVKACSKLHRDAGLWYYGNNTSPDKRGPFKQASDAMHSLRKKLVKRRPDLSRIVFWSAVIFPYIEFYEEAVEWHPWQVIDNRAFRSKPLSHLLLIVINRARKFMKECPNAPWFYSESQEPNLEQCETIAEILRPNFECFETPKSRAHRIEDEVKYFTEEQYSALDAMSMNPRVVFAGPAGTGKTVLAMEATRRNQVAGQRILFLCFNRILGKWLEDQMSDCGNVVLGTLHKFMLSAAGVPDIPSHGSEFWGNELPLLAIDRLLEGDFSPFDVLVIDEAQDILRESYLDFLDLCLKGGLATGRWFLFGDFEKQAIYGSAKLSLEKFFNLRAGNSPSYSLRINCRNTPRIAHLVHLLGGLNPGYTKILRPDDNVEPNLKYYQNYESQEQILSNTLKELYDEGFKGNEIVILSPKAEGSCASLLTIQPWRDRIRPYDLAGTGHIRFSSIHSFKGMEAPIIIVTDIEHVYGKASVSLFYIAVTRALNRLVILANESARKDIVSTLIGLNH